MPPEDKAPIGPAVYVRYGLLCLLELVVIVLVMIIVHQWIALPRWLFWGLAAAWVAKDVVLFPFVWRAYDPDRPGVGGAADMVGEVGIARDRLDPCGYVRLRGELWKAECSGGAAPIEAGRRVRVQRREGLTLFVMPNDPD